MEIAPCGYNGCMPPASEKLLPASASRRSSRSPQRINLEHTLSSGQMFRWRRGADGWWRAPIGENGLVLSCRQQGEYAEIGSSLGLREDGIRYFQLSVDMDALADRWRRGAEPEVAGALAGLSGLRVCRQDPVECLISFLCSSAAPVYRIRRMIDGLCRALGAAIEVDSDNDLHAFPTLEQLASKERSFYDALGLGYRGGHVRNAATELIARGGRAYVEGLACGTYAEAKAALVSLPGAGAKIADCVCLFSLGFHEAVPLDTHMLRIARRLVASDLAERSLTPAVYDEICARFRQRFGSHAGWAQQYLFTAELHRTGAWDAATGMHRPAARRGKDNDRIG